MKKAFVLLFLLLQCSISSAQLINIDSLKAHVSFLAHDSLEGRHAQSPKADIAAEYIMQRFKQIGLKVFPQLDTGATYYHDYAYPPHVFKNVLGVVESLNEKYKDEYIVVGAHYDHIGWEEDEETGGKIIYNGADDNASGTAAIIELARILQANKNLLKRSVIIVAFAGEELGLTGSEAFVADIDSLSPVKAMISVDMIGRYKYQNKLTITGTGSLKGGDAFYKSIFKPKGLNIEYIPSGFMWKTATDTKPFYEEGISSLHFFTGTHEQYHEPEDDIDSIDFPELSLITEHLYNVTIALSGKEEILFNKTKESNRLYTDFFKFGFKGTYLNNNHDYPDNFFNAKEAIGGGGGLFINLSFTDYFHLQAEAQYLNLASKAPAGTFRIHTFDFPAHFMLSTPSNDFARGFVLGGGYYNKPINIKNEALDAGFDMSSEYDYGYSLGFGIEILKYQISFIYRKSLMSTVHSPMTGWGRNNSFLMSLGIYLF